MKLNNITSIFNRKFFKIIIILMFPVVIISSLLIYQNITYKNFLSVFKSSFNNFEFANANNLVLSEQKYNIFKIFSLEKDLTSFFDDKISTLSDSLNTKTISNEEASTLLNEISRYNLNKDDVTTCFSLLTGGSSSQDDTYLKGIKAYEDKNYEEALNLLSKVSPSSSNYNSSLKYLKLTKDAFKPILLSKADELSKSDYYTKALDYLNSFNKTFPNDSDISNKKTEIQKAKENYLANSKSNTSSTTPSNATIINSITTSNINTLNIPSYTSYLIYVSLDEQKTYVYTGSQNKWNLKKTMICSTGISGQDTPQGVYEIGEKGDWFYSKQFGQGGKYWLQFYGNDYLFHSLPFKEDKQTVDDWTLGKKASHGCIRLPIEDSKWLYDNITRGTKVIIK
ncbi:MAG: L,D-transpeptidase family protein [Clostridium sp.]